MEGKFEFSFQPFPQSLLLRILRGILEVGGVVWLVFLTPKKIKISFHERHLRYAQFKRLEKNMKCEAGGLRKTPSSLNQEARLTCMTVFSLCKSQMPQN